MSPMNPRLLVPRASGGFDPRRIAGLAAWYDASDLSTLGNQSTGPGGATDNGPVRYFGDKSGNGRHAVQAGADSVCPTFVSSALNGRSGLSFDGGDSIIASVSVSYTEITAFLAMRFLNATPNFGRWFTMRVSGADTQSNNVIPALKTGSNQMGAYQGTTRGNISVTNAEDMVWMCRHAGANQLENRKNNGTAPTATGFSALNITANELAMGVDSMQGRIYEVLFYTRAISSDERNTIAAYLGTKWGIAVS